MKDAVSGGTRSLSPTRCPVSCSSFLNFLTFSRILPGNLFLCLIQFELSFLSLQLRLLLPIVMWKKKIAVMSSYAKGKKGEEERGGRGEEGEGGEGRPLFARQPSPARSFSTLKSTQLPTFLPKLHCLSLLYFQLCFYSFHLDHLKIQ